MGAADAIRVGPRPWVFLLSPLLPLLLIPLVFATPPRQRHADPTIATLVILGCSAAFAALNLAVWWPRWRESFTADDGGLRIISRRRGNRSLSWSEVATIGWLLPFDGPRADDGLAGRLHTGSGNAVWLCNPAGRFKPRALKRLRELAARHDVTWEDFRPADLNK